MASPQWHFADFRLDPDNACLWRGTQSIALTPKAFEVRSYWIPGSWHVRMMYTDGIPFHDPSQESDRAGQHQESHRRGAVLSDGS